MARYIVLDAEPGSDDGWMNRIDIILNTDDLLDAVHALYNRGEYIIDTEQGLIMGEGHDVVANIYKEFKWYIYADRPTHGIGNFGTPRCRLCNMKSHDDGRKQ